MIETKYIEAIRAVEHLPEQKWAFVLKLGYFNPYNDGTNIIEGGKTLVMIHILKQIVDDKPEVEKPKYFHTYKEYKNAKEQKD